jgi:hypothetical protein
MKFYTKPNETVKFIGNFNFAIVYNAHNTDIAPSLSICIYFILPDAFICRPPLSKHTPLPINAVHY